MTFSICIPIYEMKGQGEKYLNVLLESIKNQTFQDFEVIISDHSRDDALKKFCEEWKQILPITYLRCVEKHGNSSVNMNHAIKHAKGDIIKPMHQDDFFYSETCLEDIYKETSLQKNTVWGFCNFIHTNTAGLEYFKPITPYYQEKIIESMNTIGAPAVCFFPNDQKIFFDQELIWMNDCELYYQLYQKYGEPIHIPKTSIAIRIWPAQVTSSITKKIEKSEIFHSLQKHNLSKLRNVRVIINLSIIPMLKKIIQRITVVIILPIMSYLRFLYETIFKKEDLLSRISNRYRSDKGTKRISKKMEGPRHFYSPIYHSYFETIREQPLTVLEIGIGGGNSVGIWSDYFPHAQIHFIDINDFSEKYDSDRIHCHQGDQSNRDDLERVMQHIGQPIDIIIEDGGHYMNQQQISFGTLFKYLKSDGLYFIEDLHTSYWPYGEHVAVYNNVPIDTNSDKSNSTLAMIHNYLDNKIIQSEFLSEKECNYLTNNIASCKLYDTTVNHYGPNHLAVFVKK